MKVKLFKLQKDLQVSIFNHNNFTFLPKVFCVTSTTYLLFFMKIITLMLTFPLLAQFVPDPCFYHFSRRKPFCLIRSLRCTEANHDHFFLSESANYLNNPKQDEKEEVLSPSYILLYEDSEGDRMLVGDVPWEYVFGFFIFRCLFDIINYFQTI